MGKEMALSGNNKSRPKLPSWMTSAQAETGASASINETPCAAEAKQQPAAGKSNPGLNEAAAAGKNISEAPAETVKETRKAEAAVPADEIRHSDAADEAAAAAEAQTQASPADRNTPAFEDAPKAAEAEIAASPAPAAPAPDDGFVLLGAPSLAEDDGAADDLLAPTEITEDSTSESHPLACIVGGFAAPLQLQGESAAAPASLPAASGHSDSVNSVASSAVSLKNSETHDTKKMQSELEQLRNIVDAVESLDYMKPRLRKLELAGYQASDLVNLYRLASQVLLENWQNQIQRTNKLRERYEKRLRDVVIDKSSEFMQMVTSGQVPVESEEDEAAPAHEAGSFMLRKQLEIKEELLMKTRESLAEAEARYDKVARDVVNIRQRQAKDVALHLQKDREALFTKLLPVLDSFDSALAASDSFVNVESVVEGLNNIHKQLLDACMSEGLEPIEAKGKLFNPNLHQAMGSVPTDEVPEDYVVTDLRRGYLLNDKLLRATMVQVACHE